MIGGLSSTVNAQTSADTDDLDKFAAAAKVYVANILDDSNTQLEETLPAFFGGDDLTKIETLYGKFVDSGILDQSTRTNVVSKM